MFIYLNVLYSNKEYNGDCIMKIFIYSRMCKKNNLFLFFFFFVALAIAQKNEPFKDFTVESPIASNFSRYGDIPIDYSTGTPNIQIPIYDFKCGTINIPISLSYHAGGNKVRDIASPVGLGWNLNCGGIITRTTLGKADEYLKIFNQTRPVPISYETKRPRYKNKQELENIIATAPSYSGMCDELFSWLNVENIFEDYYSDIFYYDLGNGKTGKFMLDFSTNEFNFLPYENYKVKFQFSNKVNLEIIDDEGKRYYFEKFNDDTWLLVKVKDLNNNESVEYVYRKDPVLLSSFNDIYLFGDVVNPNSPVTAYYERVLTISPQVTCNIYNFSSQPKNVATLNTIRNSYQYDVPILEQIVSRNSRIEFSYLNDRIEGNYSWSNPKSRLKNIKILNSENEIVNEFEFFHTYLGAGRASRLLLDRIMLQADNSNSYQFVYNMTALPDYPHGGATVDPTLGEDFWGYYNGNLLKAPNGYDGFMECLPGPNASYSYINKFPNENLSQSGILKEIIYPTGGKNTFEYENHHLPLSVYNFNAINKPTSGIYGGLRIKKIKSFLSNAELSSVKEYEYPDFNVDSYFALDLLNGSIDPSKYIYSERNSEYIDYAGLGLDDECRPGVGRPVSPVIINTFNRVFSINNLYKIIGIDIPVRYPRVIEYFGDKNNNVGKIVYNYIDQNYEESVSSSSYRMVNKFQYLNESYKPLLTSVEVFKKQINDYKLVKRTVNNYLKLNSKSFQSGFSINAHLKIQHIANGAPDPLFAYTFGYGNNGNSDYITELEYEDAIAHTGKWLISNSTVTHFDDLSNVLEEQRTYDYNQYGQLIKESFNDSKGHVRSKEFKYPNDFPSLNTCVSLININNYSYIVENTEKLNNINIRSLKKELGYWSQNVWSTSGVILPKIETHYDNNNNVSKKYVYQKYTSDGYLIEYLEDGNILKSILRDPVNDNPLVIATSNDINILTEIAYTSFELVSKGNWVYSGNAIPDVNSITGRKVYQLSNGSIVKNSMNSSREYVLSYWTKNNTPFVVSGTVSGSPIKVSSFNEWSQYEHRIKNVTSITISGTGIIDELLLQPLGTQLKTYTYQPLIGITAESDYNRKLIFYEYDSFNRLKLIKDDKGNILKKYEYKYQQPQ